MKVLVIDTIAPEGLAFLTERGFQVEQVSSKLPREELFATIADYEAIITRSSTTVTPEFLSHASRLRILGRAGVGVDNIDIEACSRQGVVVANAPYGNVVSAAEHTVGMMLALVRKIPQAHDALKQLRWDRGIYGSELFRKTAGVIGLGKVGSRVAARLKAFEMEVLVYDPYIPESRARDLGVRLTDLGTLLGHSDIITVHVPLTDETENMIAARELALMKPGVRLVNCARGGIVQEGDLLAALETLRKNAPRLLKFSRALTAPDWFKEYGFVIGLVAFFLLASFAGVGNPHLRSAIQPGETVLDLGSGAGLDAIIASWGAGASGNVIGVDLNPSMCLKAQAHAAASGSRMECHQGRMEDIPLPDRSVDVVISNGVVNLSFRKRKVIEELFRVLKPGGRLSITDIVSAKQLSQSIVNDPKLWAS